MRKIFKSDTLENSFRKDGYLVVDFISPIAAEALQKFYLQNESSIGDTFFTTTSTLDTAYRVKMDQHIRQVTDTKIAELFLDYETLYASFIIKKRGFKGKIGLHADWQFVEEPELSAINIWIALSDLNKNTGTLKVIPGSHDQVQQLRGPNYKLEEKHYARTSELKTLPLKKGQAVIYDARLLHASSNNLFKEKRIAASALVVPKEASIWYYYFDEKNIHQPLHSHQVNKQFYLEKCNFKANNGIWEYVSP
jgi:ectoine hydroxylase-related dioxygenase (phytanoyl-CoA dioxygenase family)